MPVLVMWLRNPQKSQPESHYQTNECSGMDRFLWRLVYFTPLCSTAVFMRVLSSAVCVWTPAETDLNARTFLYTMHILHCDLFTAHTSTLPLLPLVYLIIYYIH